MGEIVRVCNNCIHGEYSPDHHKIKCYDGLVLEFLSVEVARDGIEGVYHLVHGNFGCNQWEPKPKPVYKEVTVVAISQEGRFGGYYIKHGSRYHQITTDRKVDFTPEFDNVKEAIKEFTEKRAKEILNG